MLQHSVRVALAVQGGLSTVCATCPRYWEGRDLNLPGDRCTSRTPCGSPLAGDDFHEYAGPMTAFDQWCFICGEPPAGVIAKPGSHRRFGVCEKHKRMLPTLKPTNMQLPQEAQALVNIGGGVEKTLATLFPPRKKTVWERIAETEAEFEKIDAEKG